MIRTEEIAIGEDLRAEVERAVSDRAAWGVLAGEGPGRRAVSFHPVRDAAADALAHESVKRIEREIRAAGRSILAFVFGHPDGPPRLTRDEARRARVYPTTHFLVIDTSSTPPRWGGGRFATGDLGPEASITDEVFVAARIVSD